MFGISKLAKKAGSLIKKGASNVAHGKGLMGDKTSALSRFRDWKAKKDSEKPKKLQSTPRDFAAPSFKKPKKYSFGGDFTKTNYGPDEEE